jgi:hypothetical protein
LLLVLMLVFDPRALGLICIRIVRKAYCPNALSLYKKLHIQFHKYQLYNRLFRL